MSDAGKIAEVLTGTHFIPVGDDPDIGSFLTLEGYEAEWITAALEPVIVEREKAAWAAGFKQGGPMHDVNYDDPDAHTANPYDTKEEA